MASIPTDMHDSHDDHSDHGEHEHHVSSMFTLLGVLSILLVLTIATFGAYFVEQWVSSAFGIVIPQWVNVVICMSIATVKAVLVLMYFMHLRHDNPLNTVILLFCVFAFALFLGLTAMDLGTRKSIYAVKGDKIIEGGNSKFGSARSVEVMRDGQLVVEQVPAGIALAEWVKDPAIAAAVLGDDKFKKMQAKHDAYHHHTDASTAQQSRPRAGLTPGLYDTEDDHGSGHSSGHSSDHGSDH